MLKVAFRDPPEPSPRGNLRLTLEQDDLVIQEAVAQFDYQINPNDQERIRWYLEDYPQYPYPPAPAIAAEVEKTIEGIGHKLFQKVFLAGNDTLSLWKELEPRLAEAYVDIACRMPWADAIPWELLRDPQTNTPLPL